MVGCEADDGRLVLLKSRGHKEVFFFKQKTACEMLRSLVGSEMCIRGSPRDAVYDHIPLPPGALDDHAFNVLGAGPVKVDLGANPLAVERRAASEHLGLAYEIEVPREP